MRPLWLSAPFDPRLHRRPVDGRCFALPIARTIQRSVDLTVRHRGAGSLRCSSFVLVFAHALFRLSLRQFGAWSLPRLALYGARLLRRTVFWRARRSAALALGHSGFRAHQRDRPLQCLSARRSSVIICSRAQLPLVLGALLSRSGAPRSRDAPWCRSVSAPLPSDQPSLELRDPGARHFWPSVAQVLGWFLTPVLLGGCSPCTRHSDYSPVLGCTGMLALRRSRPPPLEALWRCITVELDDLWRSCTRRLRRFSTAGQRLLFIGPSA